MQDAEFAGYMLWPCNLFVGLRRPSVKNKFYSSLHSLPEEGGSGLSTVKMNYAKCLFSAIN